MWGVIFHARTLGFRAFTSTTYALEKPGPLPRSAPQFTLINQHGEIFVPSHYFKKSRNPGLAKNSGRALQSQNQTQYILYHFMFLHCSYVCGITFSYLQELHKRLAQFIPARLLMVSITVDPERDRPRDLLEAWLSLNKPTGWILARHETTGSMRSDFEKLGVSFYRLPSGDFNHSAFFYLVDEQNHVVQVFDPAGGLDQIGRDLKSMIGGHEERQ